MPAKRIDSAQTVIDPEALLDQSQVAKILKTTTKFLEARRCRGGGPEFIRVGRLVRYDLEAVRRWVRANTVISTSGSGTPSGHSSASTTKANP